MPKIKNSILIIFACGGLLLANVQAPNPILGFTEYKLTVFSVFLAIWMLFLLIHHFSKKVAVSPLRGNKINEAVIAILLYNSLSSTLYFKNSLSQLFPLWAGTIFFIGLITAFPNMRYQKSLGYFIFFSVLTSFLIQIFTGVLQFNGNIGTNNNYYLVTGTFDNPGPYAIYLSSLAAFSFVFLQTQRLSRLTQIVSYLLLVLIAVILLLLFSRTAIIAIVFSLGAFGILRAPRKHNLDVKKLLTKLAVPVLMIFILFFFLKKDSALGRAIIWKISIAENLKHPLVGTGYGNFAHDYNLDQSHYFAKHPNDSKTIGMKVDYSTSAFNDYIQIAYEQGAIGLLFFCLLLHRICRILPKIKVELKKNAVGKTVMPISIPAFFGLLVILIASMFSDPLNHFPLLILFYFFLSLIANSLDHSQETFAESNIGIGVREKFSISIMIILATALSIFIGLTTFKKNRVTSLVLKELSENKESTRSSVIYLDNEYYLLAKSRNLQAMGKSREVIALLERAIKQYSNYRFYIDLGIAYRDQNDFFKAVGNLTIASNMIPHLVYPKFLLAKVYYEKNQQDSFLFWSKKVLYDKEKIHSDLVDGMRNEIKILLKLQ